MAFIREQYVILFHFGKHFNTCITTYTLNSQHGNIFCRYFKDNEIPSDDSRIKATITNSPAADKLTESKVTLKVPKCTKEDTGEYSLRLINKYGEAESNVSN